MNKKELSASYSPRVTFQDTNVVGNVYFLTYFRWQAECRDQWLRAFYQDLWKQVRSGQRQLLVTHWSTRFEDAFGATIGDDVAVTLTFTESDIDGISATAQVIKNGKSGSIRIASGDMRFTMRTELDPPHNDRPTGPCYALVTTPSSSWTLNPLDLLGFQGKCRELFLADYASETLRLVAEQDLILQTTTASLELVLVPPVPLEEVRVEMRLEGLKCGQIDVRFDYFAAAPNGASVRFAKGYQKMSSKRKNGSAVLPCSLPVDLLAALRGFTECELLLAKVDDILCFSSATATSPRDRGTATAAPVASE